MILQINDLSWAQLGHHSVLNWDYLISTGLDSLMNLQEIVRLAGCCLVSDDLTNTSSGWLTMSYSDGGHVSFIF